MWTSSEAQASMRQPYFASNSVSQKIMDHVKVYKDGR